MEDEEESIEEKSFGSSSIDDENFNDDLGDTLDPLEVSDLELEDDDDIDKLEE